jgi:hypothetical protein
VARAQSASPTASPCPPLPRRRYEAEVLEPAEDVVVPLRRERELHVRGIDDLAGPVRPEQAVAQQESRPAASAAPVPTPPPYVRRFTSPPTERSTRSVAACHSRAQPRAAERSRAQPSAACRFGCGRPRRCNSSNVYVVEVHFGLYSAPAHRPSWPCASSSRLPQPSSANRARPCDDTSRGRHRSSRGEVCLFVHWRRAGQRGLDHVVDRVVSFGSWWRQGSACNLEEHRRRGGSR